MHFVFQLFAAGALGAPCLSVLITPSQAKLFAGPRLVPRANPGQDDHANAAKGSSSLSRSEMVSAKTIPPGNLYKTLTTSWK